MDKAGLLEHRMRGHVNTAVGWRDALICVQAMRL